MHFGQRGISIIAPCSKIIAYIVTCNHPPYPVLPIVLTLAGFGNGLEDGAWNAWVGNMVRTNELMGILHGAYGLGATISPIISTAMITKANLPWYRYYLVLVSTLEFLSRGPISLLSSFIDWRSCSGVCLRGFCFLESNRTGTSRNASTQHE